MSWQRYLQIKTRQPEWLWRVAIGIVVAGALAGLVAQWLPPGVRQALIPKVDAATAQAELCQQLAETGQWAALAAAIPRALWLSWFPGPTIIALLTGFCWFLFLLQAGQVGSPRGVRPWLCAVGVVLGVLSIWPTVWMIYWQEFAWGLAESEEIGKGLLFYVLGVGLREELCKLLLFLPLLPFVISRGNEREAMLVAASVGLGFALEENIIYFTNDPGGTLGQFLAANLLHMSLTGLAGLALCRAIWNPQVMALEGLGLVLLMIIAHGLYDAFIVVLNFGGADFASFVIYLALVYQFFRELKEWWISQTSTISLSATVVASTATVFALTFVYLAARVGFDPAIAATGLPAIESLIFLYVVLRELPESLVG